MFNNIYPCFTWEAHAACGWEDVTKQNDSLMQKENYGKKIFVMTHASDMDGIGSAALIRMRLNVPTENIFLLNYTVPKLEYASQQILKHAKEGITLFITDTGINSSHIMQYKKLFLELKRHGGKIFWIDHHHWEEDAIKEVASMCDIAIVGENKNMCAAEITAKILGFNDAFVNELLKITHTFDFHVMNLKDKRMKRIGDIYDACFTYYGHMPTEMYTSKLRRLVGVISSKKLYDSKWVEDADRFDRINKKRIKKLLDDLYFPGKNIVLGFATFVRTNDVSDAMMKKTGRDIAVYISTENGTGHMRSVKANTIPIAMRFGGGGHPHATGFQVNLKEYNNFKSKEDKEKFAKELGSAEGS